MASFEDIFTKSAGSALAKQYAFADAVTARRYRLDLDGGVLEFDNGQSFPVQLLGREDRVRHAWVWASPNLIPAAKSFILAAVSQVKAIGEVEGIAELVIPSFSLDRADGHRVSMVASQLCDADCYFRIPDDNGATYVLLSGTPVCERRRPGPLRIVQVIEKALELCKADQEKVIVPFLEQQGFSVARQDDWYRVLTGDALQVLMRFSPDGELLEYRSKKVADS